MSRNRKESVESRILPTPSEVKRVPVRLHKRAALHGSKCVLCLDQNAVRSVSEDLTVHELELKPSSELPMRVVKYTVYVSGNPDYPHPNVLHRGVSHLVSLSVAPSEDSGGSTSRRQTSISQNGISVKTRSIRKWYFQVEYGYRMACVYH